MTGDLVLSFVATSLWQGALVAAAVFFSIGVMRIESASARATLLSAAFFTAALLPFVIFIPRAAGGVAAAIAAHQPGPALAATAAAPGHDAPEAAGAVGRLFDDASPAMALLWLAGAFWRLAGLARAAAAVDKLRRESAPVCVSRVSLSKLSGAMIGLPRNADLRSHPHVDCPMAAGFFRPSIILPADLFENDADAARCAIAHERAHIERGDLFVNAAEAAALCLFWWNPFLHLLRKETAVNREMACDDRAVVETAGAESYAAALISCAERALAPKTPLALGVAGLQSGLSRRVTRVADRNYAPQARSSLLRLSLAAAAIATTCVAAAGAAPRAVYSPAARSTDETAAPAPDSGALGRALVEAVNDNDIDLAARLLAEGADIDAVLEGDGTPLIAAVNNDAIGMAQWLIAVGADVDAVARYDETALISAVRRAGMPMVLLLIDAGADVNLSAVTETGAVRSPLGEAKRAGRRDVEAALIRAGAIQ